MNYKEAIFDFNKFFENWKLFNVMYDVIHQKEIRMK